MNIISVVYEVLLAIAYNQKTYSFCDELNINNLSYDFNGDVQILIDNFENFIKQA